MSTPSKPGKQSVNLASGGVRVSRIRRDPPPVVKEKDYVSPDERDRWVVIVGVVVFALALGVITLAAGSYAGWSPGQYTVHVKAEE